MYLHTTPNPGIMVLGTISYNSYFPLVFVEETLRTLFNLFCYHIPAKVKQHLVSGG